MKRGRTSATEEEVLSLSLKKQKAEKSEILPETEQPSKAEKPHSTEKPTETEKSDSNKQPPKIDKPPLKSCLKKQPRSQA